MKYIQKEKYSSDDNIVSHKDEITYSLYINIDNIKKEYISLSLGSDAQNAVTSLTKLFNENSQLLGFTEVFIK